MTKKRAILIILLIILIDQISKIYIKTNFMLSDKVEVCSWFQITFVENEGMAWGTKLSDFITFISDRTAKVCLTVFRILAVIAIGFWLRNVLRADSPKVLVFAIAIIFAGALGNIIDSVFYGVLFDSSLGQVATFLPDQGYDTLFHGKVVDMFYFDIWEGRVADWIPFIGGDYMSLWPVFNVADASIFIGVLTILIFQKTFFEHEEDELEEEETNAPAGTAEI